MADTHPEFGFKFAIGDDVFFATSIRECAAMNTAEKKRYTEARPQRFNVCERHVQECYGGVQRHYDLRPTMPSGSMEIIACVTGAIMSSGLYRATEHELVAATDHAHG